MVSSLNPVFDLVKSRDSCENGNHVIINHGHVDKLFRAIMIPRAIFQIRNMFRLDPRLMASLHHGTGLEEARRRSGSPCQQQ